jgi:acetylornithine deacetylase/succinyl-diaminopimelate desuccinylase-like protein
VDPFSGLIKDGCIWGRGAIDMKDMDAMILAIVRLWARIGYKPPRDIVLAFFADEEAGSIYGSRWIAKKRPELFAGCTEAISEVGGFSYTLDTGKRIYAVQSAEKGINWMKLTATGNAGHGSMINEKNAVTALTEAVTKIGRHKWPIRPTKTVKILFKKVAELTNVEYDENNLGKLLPKFGSMGSMIGATLQNIANPTMLEAGYKANVIPQSASAIIDGRFLPGYESELAETIKELVGPDIKVEVLTRDIALEVDFSGPLVDAMCAALKIEDPEGIPVPYLMSGGTDNKALSDLGIVGFGFSPIRFPADLEFMPLFHGINERVPVDGLKFGVRTLHHFLINC